MCGTLVRIRRCSSASLESGTERNCVSAAVSALEFRKPKIDEEDAAKLLRSLLDGPSRIADANSPARKSFMGIPGLEFSKVAQRAQRLRSGADLASADDLVLG